MMACEEQDLKVLLFRVLTQKFKPSLCPLVVILDKDIIQAQGQTILCAADQFGDRQTERQIDLIDSPSAEKTGFLQNACFRQSDMNGQRLIGPH